jgi:hypothetical protein
MSEILHAVMVYRNTATNEIRCEYWTALTPANEGEEWEHLATLNSRLWIQHNWDKVETKP